MLCAHGPADACVAKRRQAEHCLDSRTLYYALRGYLCYAQLRRSQAPRPISLAPCFMRRRLRQSKRCLHALTCRYARERSTCECLGARLSTLLSADQTVCMKIAAFNMALLGKCKSQSIQFNSNLHPSSQPNQADWMAVLSQHIAITSYT